MKSVMIMFSNESKYSDDTWQELRSKEEKGMKILSAQLKLNLMML